MNFVLGITRGETPSFNWFDNPYVYPNVYSIDENLKPRLLKDVEMRECTDEDLSWWKDPKELKK